MYSILFEIFDRYDNIWDILKLLPLKFEITSISMTIVAMYTKYYHID